ncbi:ferredoxin [Streptomyces griseoviridis]|uniref:Ferredoxin n=3 Tax=Streptomyces TaxID=1883 RepID=A0ABT9LJF9_STRGD|nr:MULTISPECIES: ferredoxin [Streptomyces]MDP9683360.1 ferredoxin [Streptomyces griseoviridis]GGS54347.1 ferredoxin [Streptomyces niveoruber]GGT24023.1 ferredoxin [Streptomyces griseoviridis]GGU50841.1 ferredoxin [Streptomyces daghestanicus]GHI31707.1 ferredoxin [Streptomyces daghestanicus]
MKLTVDQDKCCGAGACVLSAPEVFDQREEDGIVTLLTSEPAAEHHVAVHEAAAVCPTAAIRVTETDRIAPPGRSRQARH